MNYFGLLLWGFVACQTDEQQSKNETGEEEPENSCEVRSNVLPTTDFFVDISEESGIRVDNFDPEPPAGMVINDHSRLAFADINGDGFDDIVKKYFTLNSVPYLYISLNSLKIVFIILLYPVVCSSSINFIIPSL